MGPNRYTTEMYVSSLHFVPIYLLYRGEVGGWGRDPKKCTGRDWVMGSSTIQWNLRPVVKYHLRRGVGFMKFLENGSRPQPPTSPIVSLFCLYLANLLQWGVVTSKRLSIFAFTSLSCRHCVPIYLIYCNRVLWHPYAYRLPPSLFYLVFILHLLSNLDRLVWGGYDQ